MEPIIDAHVHIMTKDRIAGLMRWIRRAFPDHPVDPTITEARIAADLERKGIRFFFNYVYPLKPEETPLLNEFNENLARRVPQAAPFGSLHFDTPDKREVTRQSIEERGLVGMKFHPFVQRFDPSDEKMFCVYELMEEYGRPVVLHTGFEEFYRMKMKPADIERILSHFPRLVLVLAHCLFPYFREVRELMEKYRGVWLDATNVFGALEYLRLIGSEDKTGGAARRHEELFGDLIVDYSGRTLFGTDHPVGMGDLDGIYRDFFSFDLPEGVRRQILWDNPLAFIESFAPPIHERWSVMMRGSDDEASDRFR